jgi:hypothetical protein
MEVEVLSLQTDSEDRGETDKTEESEEMEEEDQGQSEPTDNTGQTNFQKIRAEAARGLRKQAKKMLDRSVAKLKVLEVGDNVLVPVSEFDRGRADPPNLIGIVLRKETKGYKIGTRAGVLQGIFARNQIEMTRYKGLKADMVQDQEKELSVRTAVRALSIGKGQGKKRCTCKTGCISARCSCFSAGFDCTSACHPRLTCSNVPR